MLAASLILACMCPACCADESGRTFHGFSQPWETIDVSVAEPGKVVSVSVREGDSVERGQLLAALDDTVLRASLQVAKQRASAGGEEASARAKLNHAAKRHDDMTELLKEDHASQTELDQAALALHEAEAALLMVQEKRDIALADLARIQAELDRRQVRSPLSGVVVQLHRKAGEFAGVANHVVATVAVLDTLRVRIHVPTKVSLSLSPDQPITVEFPEIESRVIAKVDYISPVTDGSSGTVRVDLKIDNSKNRLRSGLLAHWNPDAAETVLNISISSTPVETKQR